MQIPNAPLNLLVHMGQEKKDHQQKLAQVSITNHSGLEQTLKIKQKAKFGEDIGEDLVGLLKYYVQAGRENEAELYLQVGLKGQMEKQFMSPLQFITRNPNDESYCRVTTATQPGEVHVIYRFFGSVIDEQMKQKLLGNVSKFHSLTTNVLLKGFISHSLKNRANVKVDYSRIHLSANTIDSEILKGIISENDLLPSDIIENPFFLTLGKIRKLNLTLRYKSFREMNKYYEKVMEMVGNSYKKQQKEDYKYINHGIFREKAEAYLFYSNKFALEGQLTHGGEDIFMRLIKVYFKAAKKGLDI